MEFLSLEASDYESALRQARSEYGNAVRIHTRKDFTKASMLSKQKRCKITFYLVESKPPVSVVEEDPGRIEVFDADAYMQELLVSNDVPSSLHAEAKQLLVADKGEHSRAEVEIALLQYLFDGMQFEEEISSRYAVFVGAAGVGKTTISIKTALHLRSQKAKRVALLSLDTNRVGSLGHIRQLSREFALPLFEASHEKALSELLPSLESFDHVLVDTCSFSAKYEEMKPIQDAMLALLGEKECSTYLVLSATFKESDLAAQLQIFSPLHIRAGICTKLDETRGIGTLLGFTRKSNLPLLFLSDGQTIPDDLHIASASHLMKCLQGFSLDVTQFFPSA